MQELEAYNLGCMQFLIIMMMMQQYLTFASVLYYSHSAKP